MIFSFLGEKKALKFVIDCFSVSAAPAQEFLVRGGKVDKPIISQLILYSVFLSTFPPPSNANKLSFFESLLKAWPTEHFLEIVIPC